MLAETIPPVIDIRRTRLLCAALATCDIGEKSSGIMTGIGSSHDSFMRVGHRSFEPSSEGETKQVKVPFFSFSAVTSFNFTNYLR